MGDTVLLNVRVPGGASSDNVGAGSGGCDAPNLVKARVAAITQHAYVVYDTRNPSPGFSDAQYASIGATFDTLIWPVDTRHFGVPLDVDHNGHVIIFYTRAVNGLTPAHSNYYVGGFYYGRDLFPTTTQNGLSGCAGSNAGEIMYLLAPDQSGAINGNVRDTGLVRRITVGTVGHEFQHLINAERRLYVLNTPNFDEQVWLNEGLSHIAEELNFYQSAGLSPAGQPGQSPRARLTGTAIRAQANGIGALNGFEFQNLARLSLYLGQTETFSPYTDNDSLQTRGATWSFLRYAADRTGRSDSALFYTLVNSTTTGIANLRAAVAAAGGASAGVALETWFRDWAVSHEADGLAPVSAPYAQPSWLFRDVLTVFKTTSGAVFNNGVYPLATRPLADGVAQTVSVGGGSAAYFRFAVPAGGTATFHTMAGASAPPATVSSVVVQTTGPNAGTVTPYDGAAAASATLPNASGDLVAGVLVVFNGNTTPSAQQALTVSGTGIGAPAASVSTTLAIAGGPTRARLAAARTPNGVGEPMMSDAGVMRRLREANRTELASRVAGAVAAYRDARRSGDYRAWTRPAYVAGTRPGLTVRP